MAAMPKKNRDKIKERRRAEQSRQRGSAAA
jgi:hypothetical protein